MVERRKIAKELKPLVIVDLDGTLIKGNTFHIFMRCGMRYLLSQGKIFSLAYALFLMALRKCRIISHQTLKFHCLPLFGSDAQLKSLFTETIAPLFNENVKDLLDNYRSNDYGILLATAAADTYVPWLWSGDFQATRMRNNPSKIENRGELKLINALEYCKTNGFEPAVVITDHYHDLPLLSYGATNILVDPSEQTLERIKCKNIHISEIIK